MSFSSAVLLILLAACAILGLVVVAMAQSLDDVKRRLASTMDERDALASEVTKLREQAEKVQKIEEKRNEQKDAVAAGGFPASVSVLSDIARRGKPKA